MYNRGRREEDVCIDGTLAGHKYITIKNGIQYCCFCGRPKNFKARGRFEDKKYVEHLHGRKQEIKYEKWATEAAEQGELF